MGRGVFKLPIVITAISFHAALCPIFGPEARSPFVSGIFGAPPAKSNFEACALGDLCDLSRDCPQHHDANKGFHQKFYNDGPKLSESE